MKSTALKRLLLFLFFAFALSWIPWIILNKTVGYDEWFTGGHYSALVLLTGGGPAFANLLTRLITKEGWKDSKLHLNLKGNLKYYVIALLTPLLYGAVRGLLLTAKIGDFGADSEYSAAMRFVIVLQAMYMSVMLSFNTFGEEFGWRAYMNPKMEQLCGKPLTILLGGICWALWHAPLTVCGHNYGTDYPGFPWLGIVLMCGFCTCTGIFLMWLTDRTDSVYPAAIAHAVINNGALYIMQLFLLGVPEDAEITFSVRVLAFLPDTVLSAVIFGILMLVMRQRKATKPAA